MNTTSLSRRRGRTLAVLTTVLVGLVVGPASASAVAEDCGPGVMDFMQGAGYEVVMIEGVRISGLGAACEGQVVGLRFTGNDAGDPTLPTTVLAESYSDEDPCTGDDLAVPRVVTNGAVDILLCESSATAGFVNGHDLTDARAITPAGVANPVPVTDPGSTPDGAPDPAPDAGPMAATGIDGLLLAGLGALAMLLGAGMLRASRRRLTH